MRRQDAAHAFIRANTMLRAVAFVPEIRLHQADAALPLWEATEAALETRGLAPPFWAFAWAGGQALARYLIDHPETVRGRCVRDLGTGSGLVAIAAALAGAARVTAVDIDPHALASAALNARANGVRLTLAVEDLAADGGAPAPDLVTVADLFYERDLAARVLATLRRHGAAGARVLVADPGRTYLPKAALVPLETYTVPVCRDVEDRAERATSVYALAD